MIGLKIAATIIGVYAGIRLAGIGIEWLKEGFDSLRPPKNRRE